MASIVEGPYGGVYEMFLICWPLLNPLYTANKNPVPKDNVFRVLFVPGHRKLQFLPQAVTKSILYVINLLSEVVIGF